MKAVAYTVKARKGLRAVAPPIRSQVEAKLHRYAQTGAGDVIPLVGSTARRLRSGDYRVLFIETETQIEVFRVGHRRDVYE